MVPPTKTLCLLVILCGVSLAFPTPHEGDTAEKTGIIYFPQYEACIQPEDEENPIFELIMCLMEQETAGAFRGLFPADVLETESCGDEPSEIVKTVFIGARDAVEICIMMEEDPFPSDAMRQCIFSTTLIQLGVFHENISPAFRVIFDGFYACAGERNKDAHRMCLLTEIIFADHGFGAVTPLPENTPIYPVTLMAHELWNVMKDCVAELDLVDAAALSYCASLEIIDRMAKRKIAIAHHLAKFDNACAR